MSAGTSDAADNSGRVASCPSGSRNMFLAQGAGMAFQSRASAVFGDLPSANLPKDIPDDLPLASSSGSGSDQPGMDTIRRNTRETYIATSPRQCQQQQDGSRKRRHDDGGRDDGFERPPPGLVVPSGPSPRKRRNRGYRPPDHVLHPERYTKYTLEESGDSPFAKMTDEEKNRAGASQLFAEMRRRREEAEREEHGEDDTMDTGRVVFRRASDRKTKTANMTAGSAARTNSTSGRQGAVPEGMDVTDDDCQADGEKGALSFEAATEGDDVMLPTSASSESATANSSSDAAPIVFSSRRKFGRRRARATSGDDDDEDGARLDEDEIGVEAND